MADWKDDNEANTQTATGSVDICQDRTVKEYTASDLWAQAWNNAGETLFYMQFLHPHIFDSQRERVERMCYHLAAEYRAHLNDTSDNREWFRNWIKKFDDEVENQC